MTEEQLTNSLDEQRTEFSKRKFLATPPGRINSLADCWNCRINIASNHIGLGAFYRNRMYCLHGTFYLKIYRRKFPR